ncbi:RCC1 domain-containing protein [Enhygromyxa salina]|nr:hypothetical protein [Enhygromyxa salina]
MGDVDACWARDDGRLVCWGVERDGSLGGMVPGVLARVPRAVLGLTDIVQLEGYGHRRCALTGAGEVHCFGHMQLRETTFWYHSPPPYARTVYTSLDHTAQYVVDEAGRLAWFPPRDAELPEEWTVVDGVGDIVELAVSNRMGCVRTGAQKLYCFERDVPPRPERIDAIEFAVELSGAPQFQFLVLDEAGVVHSVRRQAGTWVVKATGITNAVDLQGSCAILATGSVECEISGKIRKLAGAGPAHRVETFYGGACVLAALDGTVSCMNWEDDRVRRVPYLSPARAISRYEDGLCVIHEGGELRCVNKRRAKIEVSELRGEDLIANAHTICVMSLGQVTCSDSVTPNVYQPPVDDAVGFERFGNELCVRRADDSLMCVRRSSYRELRAGPVRGLGDVVELGLGHGFACARGRAGQVHCWGVHGQDGQLGDGRARATLTPTRVQGIDDATDLAAGKSTACVVHSNGEVACWGETPNLDGDEAASWPTPEPLSGFDDVIEVAVELAPSPAVCARHRDGSISCTGDSLRCDVPEKQPRGDIIKIPGIADAVELEAGEGFFCAIEDRGAARELVCWGPRTEHYDQTRECDDPPWRVGLPGLRGLQLGRQWLCADVSDERGPTCWGQMHPAGGPGSIGVWEFEAPGISFPFITTQESNYR